MALKEKPTLAMQINAGIYVVNPSVLQRIPSGIEYPITNLVEGLLGDGALVKLHHIDDDWIDVGQKEELAAARGEKLSLD